MMASSCRYQAWCCHGFSTLSPSQKPGLFKTRPLAATLSSVSSTLESEGTAATVAPKRFSHLFSLLSQILSSEDISLILEPWLPILSVQDWNVLIEDVGLKSWSKSLQIFHTFTQRSDLWQDLIHHNKELGHDTRDVLKICTSLVRVLGKKKRKEEVGAIQEQMRRASIVPDTAFYNALFMLYADQGCPDEISEGLVQMESSGIKPDHLTYEALITAYLKGEIYRIDRPASILEGVIKQGLPVSAKTFRKLILAYWEAEDVEGAEKMFNTMLHAGYLPDLKVITKLMQLHGRQGNHKRNLELFSLLGNLGIKQKGTAYGFLLHAYCKAGLIQQACKTFGNFEKATGSKPSLVAFNMIIDACGKHGLYEESIQYYGDLCNSGLEANVVSYCSIISATVKVGKYKKAEQLYKRMLAKEIKPNLHIYLTMIHCYTKSKATRLGHELYFAMKKSKMKITETAYSTVLALYVEGRWYDHAARILKQIEKEGLNLDVAAHGLLIRTFGVMDDTKIPLAEQVEASQFSVCKLLKSLSLTRIGRVELTTVHHNKVAEFVEGLKDGDRNSTLISMYNSLLDCLWQRGLRRTAQVLLEKARGICAGNTRPQWHSKECILDVRGLSIGGSKVAVADWLNHVEERMIRKDTGKNNNREMVIVTGVGVFSQNEDVLYGGKGLKGALVVMLEGLGSPFVESPENPTKLRASAEEVSKWMSGGAVRRDMSLVDCC